jgi:hypothetical protein
VAACGAARSGSEGATGRVVEAGCWARVGRGGDDRGDVSGGRRRGPSREAGAGAEGGRHGQGRVPQEGGRGARWWGWRVGVRAGRRREEEESGEEGD